MTVLAAMATVPRSTAKYSSPTGRARAATVKSAWAAAAPSAVEATEMGMDPAAVTAVRSRRMSTDVVPAGTVHEGPGPQSARSQSATGAPVTVTVTGPVVAAGATAAAPSSPASLGAAPWPRDTWTAAPSPA
jgi:hypothetical protein